MAGSQERAVEVDDVADVRSFLPLRDVARFGHAAYMPRVMVQWRSNCKSTSTARPCVFLQ